MSERTGVTSIGRPNAQSLRRHERDKRVLITDNVDDVCHLNQTDVKLVLAMNAIDENLQAVVSSLSEEQRQSLISAWRTVHVDVVEVDEVAHFHLDNQNEKIREQHTPELIYKDIRALCSLHYRSFGYKKLSVFFLDATQKQNSTHGFHFDGNSDCNSSNRSLKRLARVYKGSVSEWLIVEKDLSRGAYMHLQQDTRRPYKAIYDNMGKPYPLESIKEGCTAAWKNVSCENPDPNTGFFHRRVSNVDGRLVVIVDNQILNNE